MNGTLATVEPRASRAERAAETDDSPLVSDLEWEAKSAAAILDLVGKIHEVANLTAACHTLAAELLTYLGCDRVAIGLCRGAGGPCRLAAVSGIADLDSRSDIARSMEAALDESVLRDTATAWSSSENQERDAAVSHKKLALRTGAGSVLSAPLRTASGSAVGAWMFLGSETFADRPCHRRFIEACSPAVAGGLQVLQQFQPGLVRRSVQRMVRAMPLLRGKAVWALSAVLAASLFIPMPYVVSVECELRPVVRRFVAAPFAGEFEKSMAKPGDLVTRGRLLGRMEGRDVRWELAGLIADQQRARKSRDANMAAGKTADRRRSHAVRHRRSVVWTSG